MEIKYTDDQAASGMLTTECPNKTNSGVRVGSNWCQKCEFFISSCWINNIVTCSYKEEVE